jgi:hypothetical protein
VLNVKREKNINDFHKDKYRSDGVKIVCKECLKRPVKEKIKSVTKKCVRYNEVLPIENFGTITQKKQKISTKSLQTM